MAPAVTDGWVHKLYWRSLPFNVEPAELFHFPVSLPCAGDVLEKALVGVTICGPVHR